MHKIKIIRSITAFVLLLLFVVSNTPKQVMHDIFANHRDSKKGIAERTGVASIYQLSFHCQCDHLVVESPFTDSFDDIDIDSSLNYLEFTSSSYIFITATHQFQPGLRGPPEV